MRALFDFLARYVEPYVSYRFLLGLVFGAIFLNGMLGAILAVRDLGRAHPDATPREQALRRVARTSTLLLLFRLFSWNTARRHLAIIVQLTLLLAIAVALNIYVFFAE